MSEIAQQAPADVTEKLSSQIDLLVSSQSGCFSCGGSIPVVVKRDGEGTPASPLAAAAFSPPVDEQADKKNAKASTSASGVHDANKKTTSKPVTVRWDPPSAPLGESRNVSFPLSANASDTGTARLEALLRDCAPATFGRGNQDVLDESYRKASKLDASAFATDFCSYKLGIVATAAELLMPGVGLGSSRAVEAELYKLNVYAAPSGHFKAHVDTPRSEQQFGSLVVCLPCEHKGGALVVRHAGNTVTHDWSMTDDDAPAIRWAAFYSDCEHEVLEVTAGHRVTLTYNLYAVPHRVLLEGKTESLDVTSLPLYHAVKDAVDNSHFLPQGGILGCYCRHWYPHAAESPKNAPLFPSILKGSDLYLYCVFVALGLDVEIKAVLDTYDPYADDEEEVGEPGGGADEVWVSKRGCGTGAVHTDWGAYDDGERDEAFHRFGQRKAVHWLNAPVAGTKQVGFYRATYGNEASLDSHYTYAALLVKIKRNAASAASAPSTATL